MLEFYYRNKIKCDKLEPIKFQILSWETVDKEINDDEYDLEYKIYAFGVTDKNHSICVEINEFTPFFMLKYQIICQIIGMHLKQIRLNIG